MQQTLTPSRNWLFVFFLLAGLTACRTTEPTHSARYHDQDFILPSAPSLLAGQDAIAVITDNAPLALFSLDTNQAGYRTYHSTQAHHLTLYLGRITNTVGYPHNYTLEIPPTTFDPLEKGMHNIWGGEFAHFVVELPAQQTRIPIEATYQFWGEDQITIRGHTYNATHVVEIIRSSVFSETFENHFWVSPDDGFIYRSIQQYVPEIAPIGYTVISHDSRIKTDEKGS